MNFVDVVFYCGLRMVHKKQMQQVAEDSAEAEMFDLIEGHEWQQGVLLFRIKW